MKTNLKSQKGAITLVVLVAMLFLTSFLMSMYIQIANKAKTSAETTKQIEEQYNNIEEANTIYNSYFANTDIIPIYTRQHLEKIGSGEQIDINGKIYIFSSNAYYTIQNDLDFGGYYDEITETWGVAEGDEWTPLPLTDGNGNQYEFTGVLDGLGHTITGLYMNNSEDYQGLFGTLDGTVKNLNIHDSYINANEFVGTIAGFNNGTIQECHSKAIVLGNSNIGGLTGFNTGNLNVRNIENFVIYNDNLLSDKNVLTVSTRYIEENNVAVIPKGFNVIEVNGEKSIDDGLVIRDEEGNEFVWIPVKINSGDTKNNISLFYRSEWADNKRSTSLLEGNSYIEPYQGNSWEVTEYNNMVQSVYNNGGFYMGRYEAGAQLNGEATPRTSSSSTTFDVVVKRDQYPYNFIGWGDGMTSYDQVVNYGDLNRGVGAAYLSKNMYTAEDNVGVISTLCYGVQWDAMLDFIKDTTRNVTDSVSWGNYRENTWTIDRTTVKYYDETEESWKSAQGKTNATFSEAYLLTTGASESFAAKNMYDVAGNTWEWTMETYVKESGEGRVYRSGDYYGTKVYPTTFRGNHYELTWSDLYCSFRPALYIK